MAEMSDVMKRIRGIASILQSKSKLASARGGLSSSSSSSSYASSSLSRGKNEKDSILIECSVLLQNLLKAIDSVTLNRK